MKQIQEILKGDVITFTSGSDIYYTNQYLVDGEYIFYTEGVADIKYNNIKHHIHRYFMFKS